MKLDLNRPLLPGILLIAMVGLTLVAGHLFVPGSKGLLFWSTIILLTLIETTMVLGGLIRFGREEQGSATGVVLWAWFGGFFLVSLGLIILKAMLGDGMRDGVFGGLILVTVLCYVIFFSALIFREKAVRSDERGRAEAQGEEQSMARILRAALGELSNLDVPDLEGKQSRERLAKQIESCAQALEHAQGNLPTDPKLRDLCVTISTLINGAFSTAVELRGPYFADLNDPVSQLKRNLSTCGIL